MNKQTSELLALARRAVIQHEVEGYVSPRAINGFRVAIGGRSESMDNKEGSCLVCGRLASFKVRHADLVDVGGGKHGYVGVCAECFDRAHSGSVEDVERDREAMEKLRAEGGSLLKKGIRSRGGYWTYNVDGRECGASPDPADAILGKEESDG